MRICLFANSASVTNCPVALFEKASGASSAESAAHYNAKIMP